MKKMDIEKNFTYHAPKAGQKEILTMEAKEGFAPCGKLVDDERHEQWRQEMSCCIVGCKSCNLYDGGKIYYEQTEENMKKGLSIWARAYRPH